MWQLRDRSTLTLSQQAPMPFGPVTARWARLYSCLHTDKLAREETRKTETHSISAEGKSSKPSLNIHQNSSGKQGLA